LKMAKNVKSLIIFAPDCLNWIFCRKCVFFNIYADITFSSAGGYITIFWLFTSIGWTTANTRVSDVTLSK
jgi:hypothetical protein